MRKYIVILLSNCSLGLEGCLDTSSGILQSSPKSTLDISEKHDKGKKIPSNISLVGDFVTTGVCLTDMKCLNEVQHVLINTVHMSIGSSVYHF